MDHTSRWSGRALGATTVLLLTLGLSPDARAQAITATIDSQGNLSIQGARTASSITVSGGSTISVFANGNRVYPRISGSVGNGQVRSVSIRCGIESDVVNCSGCSLRCIIRGGPGSDILIGGSNSDQIYGEDGDDVITGNGGNDFIQGGSGKDTINGGPGSDTIDAGAGDDTIDGGTGADLITGGLGIDKITLGPANIPGTTGTNPTPGVYDKIKDFGRGGDTKTDSSNVGWATIRTVGG